MKRIFSIFIIAALLLLSACTEAGVFVHCEMVLTLTEDFETCDRSEPFVIRSADGTRLYFSTSNAESADLTLSDGNAAVILTRISKQAAYEEGIPDVLTQLDFARLYIQRTDIDAEPELLDDFAYCSYNKTSESGDSFSFLLSFYASPHAYFIVSYITAADRFDDMRQTLIDYASAVRFEE